MQMAKQALASPYLRCGAEMKNITPVTARYRSSETSSIITCNRYVRYKYAIYLQSKCAWEMVVLRASRQSPPSRLLPNRG